MRRSGYLLTIILATVLLVACAAGGQTPSNSPTTLPPTPQSIRLEDGLGTEIELPAAAQRIVSLAPSNTEILFALGAGSQIIGRDSFSDYPPEALQIKDVGGGFGNLDVETIIALQPDLVLASPLTAAEQVQGLRDLGLTVFVLPNPLQFEDLYTNLMTVAMLTGRVEQAEALITQLKQRVQSVDERLGGIEQRPLVFYEIDGTDPNAPWTAGPDTFIDMLITRAGGLNFGHELQGEWVQVSLEEILRRDPDLILLGDAIWGGVTVEAVMARPGWGELSAVKNQRVYPFDDNIVSRPGPRLVEGLEALARLFHPDRFQ
ncbi:MAG: Vitamin B12 ABC transporter, B12-binding component BtuF [Anaerolineae bacterium]|nr:MAG: Vitamin B12 ABC transporter, B12-binding component BtuF [Anaerolineae bacterium]